MEATIRGLVEQNIEQTTETKQLANIAIIFRESFPIGSLEDCLFGYVIGNTVSYYVGLNAVSGRRELTHEETKKLWDVLKGRTMYIKGRIKLALGNF